MPETTAASGVAASTQTPGVAAPGKPVSRSAAKRHAAKNKHLCPVCGVNPIGEDEVQCAACAEKEEMASEGRHIGRNWLILIVTFTLLMLLGKWVATRF